MKAATFPRVAAALKFAVGFHARGDKRSWKSPSFAVSTQMRPDGGALLTLRNGEEIVTRRVVSAAQLADEKRMYWFINAVRRDLALEAGSLPVDVVGTLRRLQERGLPSYMAG
ncbi:DUF3509 domain-containing protein [Pseudomonas aeruginosa]|nr:DUF3509 domain-containing protein [Pseudomonas aeruginosa]